MSSVQIWTKMDKMKIVKRKTKFPKMQTKNMNFPVFLLNYSKKIKCNFLYKEIP